MAEPAAGAGSRTPLVCLHQSPTSGAYYKEFIAEMAADRLVIAPDTPGFGGSDAPPSLPDMEDYGAAVAAALSDLGYGADSKGPLDLLGFHTGNFIAIEIAVQRPDLVRRLVMPGIPYYPASEREAKRQQYAQPRPYFSDPDYLSNSYRQSVLKGNDAMTPERRLEMFTERLRAGVRSWWGFDAVFRYDPEGPMRNVTHPVLLPILNETLAQPTRNASTFLQKPTVVEMPDETAAAWFTGTSELAAAIRPFLDGAA